MGGFVFAVGTTVASWLVLVLLYFALRCICHVVHDAWEHHRHCGHDNDDDQPDEPPAPDPSERLLRSALSRDDAP